VPPDFDARTLTTWETILEGALYPIGRGTPGLIGRMPEMEGG
jgi:hypothetical protein